MDSLNQETQGKEYHRNPKIEWKSINGIDCLMFTFTGTLTFESALTAVADWKNHFSTRSGQKIVMVWQCSKMHGYESEARRQWQHTLKILENQIDDVWLISDSLIIQTGAKLMALFAKFNLKVVGHENEVYDSIRLKNIS
jgi:hypothetical protein